MEKQEKDKNLSLESMNKYSWQTIQNSSDLNHIDHASEAKSADATIPKYGNRGTVDAAIPDQPMSSEEALPNKLRKPLSTKEALPRELGTSMSFEKHRKKKKNQEHQ
ncbi:unnamed protein product [Malus baccata var. baccata]